MRWQQLLQVFLMTNLAGAALAHAQAPDQVRVRGIRSSGQGCPLGSAEAVISPDAQSFSLLLDNYMAQAQPGVPTSRRDCDIEVDLDIPSGWSYALVGADYRGFVDVPAGAVAAQRVIYAFEQSRDRRPGYSDGKGFAFNATEFRGPTTQDYTIQHTLNIVSAPRSGCSSGGVQTLYMNTLLMARLMSARHSTSTITLDSMDGSVQSQNYRLAWFRCDHVSPRPDPRDPRPPRRPLPPRRPGRGGR
ncbi:MAG: DUF4360 domain-containing protein [Bdellovibrionales bacterium]